ncbi:caldesmon-like [Dendronephthya gigantea]|uniref:caldesmon-like n=1 Tax=Dendronephthya gigantea TaxID=151771 RepID=UPI00106B003D|nr:caldesmon-like [Dendronephthya gigantea]
MNNTVKVPSNDPTIVSTVTVAAEKQVERRSKNTTSKPFQWTEDHDILLCREILVCEPFYLKPRSQERGKTWDKIAQNLNMLHHPKFRVTSRSVRDRCSLLTAKRAQKLNDEEKASGIDVEETELDNLLEEILEKETLGKEQIELDAENNKAKAEKEKRTAESIREDAMKRMTTKKRKSKSESDDVGDDEEENDEIPSRKKKRVRRSTSDAISYLQVKAEKEYSLRLEEINLRKKELETAAEREKAKAEHQENQSQQQQDAILAMMQQMQQQQQNQQNLQAMLMTQQQQQNQMLMALMERNGSK